jgi:hypothetical protein
MDMGKWRVSGLVLTTMLCLASVSGQTRAAQSPREALIELLSSPAAGSTQRHLLNETQAKLRELSAEMKQRFDSTGMMAGQTARSNKDMQWFSTGPILVSIKSPKDDSRVEVAVEREEQKGDLDELELAIRVHKDGPLGPSSILPKIMVTMKLEQDTWKLAEVGFSVRTKLDAALVDSLTKQFKSIPPTLKVEPVVVKTVSQTDLTDAERSAAEWVKKVVAAETTYKSTYADVGYTCSLLSLGGEEAVSTTADHAKLINNAIASGAYGEYRFMLTGCRGTPGSSFKVIAVPDGPSRRGRKAFCSDQNGLLHYADDGRGVTCMSENNLLK